MTARRGARAALAVALAGAWVAGAMLLWPTTVPGDLHAPHVDLRAAFGARTLERAASFSQFERIDALLAELVVLAVLVVYAARGERFTRESAAGPIGTGMLLGMLGLALVWLAQLPFSVADLWWQRRHGLAKVGYVQYLFGNWAALGGTFLFLCLAILIVMGLARLLGRAWPLAAVPLLAGLTALFALVSPWLLTDAHPLRRPALVADARALAREQGVAGTRVYVQDVHRQTTAPNAEALGLGPGRRVVLWDTLLDGRYSRRQVRVVVAHELGHVAHDHVPKLVGWQALFLVPLAIAVELLTRRRGGLRNPTAVPAMLLVVAVLSFVASPLTNLVSRRMEAEADWSALRATRDPAAARGLFERFARDTYEQPSPPGWAVALFENHPTLAQRVAMADAWAARARRGG